MTESKSDEELVNSITREFNGWRVGVRCSDYFFELKSDLLARLAKGRAAEEWKRQAMEVESHWDKQRVAKLLGIGLGKNILENIEPNIIELQRQLKEAEELVENLKCCGNCIIDGDDCDYRGHSPQRYCDRYMSDDLTRKERE